MIGVRSSFDTSATDALSTEGALRWHELNELEAAFLFCAVTLCCSDARGHVGSFSYLSAAYMSLELLERL